MQADKTVFLMYHELEMAHRPVSVTDPGYMRYVVTADSFREQMNWLRQEGWRGKSVSQALEFSGQPGVALTFDDGCETDLLAAAPILQTHEFNATFYITVAFLGRRGHLTAVQLRELASLGFEIGCHSMTHAYLDDLNQEGLEREIVQAKHELEDIIGKPVAHFSCPGGRFDSRVTQQVEAAGYRTMATSQVGAHASASNPFSLGRCAVLRDLQPMGFQRLCSGEDLWKIRLRGSVQDAGKRLLGNALYGRVRSAILKNR